MRTWPFIAAPLTLAFVMGWASDSVTLEGERTVYTVDCAQGEWHGATCTGRLVAGDRYRFRALRAHSEVVFWTSGSRLASSKLEGCKIIDGRNWTCPLAPQAAQTVTLQMVHGCPMADKTGTAKRFHAVAKWRWWLLKWGAPVGSEADVTAS